MPYVFYENESPTHRYVYYEVKSKTKGEKKTFILNIQKRN